jgi:hypothetical protein
MKTVEILHEKFDLEINETITNVQEVVEQTADDVHSQNSLIAYQTAGTFTVLGCMISCYHMSSHLRHLHQPEIQRKVISILWFPPIYSVCSFFALLMPSISGYFFLITDLYEAFSIYNFLSFLINLLGKGDRNAAIDQLAKHADHMHPPMHFNPWQQPRTYATSRLKAEAVLDQCQFFSMQFVFVRPVTSIIMAISDSFHESRWDFQYPQIYANIIMNISIFFAFNGLLKFYHVVKDDLKWCNPFSKFLSIKMVVFVTFWQGIALSFIAHSIYLHNDDENVSKDSTDWAKKAQSFLICLEMFIFAIVHVSVFPAEEWRPGYKEEEMKRNKTTLTESMALKDFVSDVQTVIRSQKARKAQYHKVERSPSPEKKLDAHFEIGSLDDEEEENKDDPDWSQKWTRIEEFIEQIGSEDSDEDRSAPGSQIV